MSVSRRSSLRKGWLIALAVLFPLPSAAQFMSADDFLFPTASIPPPPGFIDYLFEGNITTCVSICTIAFEPGQDLFGLLENVTEGPTTLTVPTDPADQDNLLLLTDFGRLQLPPGEMAVDPTSSFPFLVTASTAVSDANSDLVSGLISFQTGPPVPLPVIIDLDIAAGTITGFGVNAIDGSLVQILTGTGMLTPLPEPGFAMMLGAGVLGLAGLRRR
ncbi:MAG: hypothetical protein AAGC67_02130 [Myxococcota bacterium]